VEGARPSAVSAAAALANDAIVPGELHALFRCIDTAVVLSTTANAAPLPGMLRCNSGSERTTAKNGSCILSSGSIATRCDRRELARLNVSIDLEEGPRERLSRKVKSRIEAADLNPRRLFPQRRHHTSTSKPFKVSAPIPSIPVVELMAIHLRPSNSDYLYELADIS
jgi:hypothetical protein